MKYRINEGQSSLDGSVIYRVYRVEGDVAIYMHAEGTLDKAREWVERMRNPKPEVTVAEIDV